MCTIHKMKYDTRNCFQNIVNIKGALCFCTVAAVLFLGLTVCLVTLSLTGILGSSRAPGSNGPGSPIEVSQQKDVVVDSGDEFR